MRKSKGEVMPTKESSAHYEAFCATCEISKTFLTPQGINFFRISHEGHNIEIREPEGIEAIERSPSAIAESPLVEAPVKKIPAPVQEEDAKQTIELKRLSVELVENEGQDVFRVLGFSGNFHTFFRLFELGEVSEAENFIEGGAHVDEYGNEYSWSSDVVEPTLQVKDLMNLKREATEEEEAQPQYTEELKPEPRQTPKEEAPRPKQTPKEEAPRPKQTPKEAAVQPEPAPTVKEVLGGPLLLGKTSHVQEGEEYREEALRISKALGQFRWNIEPPYVIGAIFDDIASIQAQAGAITKDVIEKIEELGYRFIAVDAPNGCVTAWFKKVDARDAERGGGYRSNAADLLALGSFRGAFSLGGEKSHARSTGEKPLS